MINRTLVASLAIVGLGLAILPTEASARAGGVSGGRASFHVGARIAPRPLIRNVRVPLNTVARRHHGKPFHNDHHRHNARRDRDRGLDGTPAVTFVPESSDYPFYGVGPMADPAFTGSVPSGSLDQGTSDLASARSCKGTTQMVPSERGGMVPVTITRCRPLDN